MTKTQQMMADIYKSHWYAAIAAKCGIRKVVVQSVVLSAADAYSREDGFNRQAFLDSCFGNNYPEGIA